MDNVKDDIYYAKKVVVDMQFLIANTKGQAIEQISKNEILLDSIMFRLIQISENTTKLSENFKRRNNEIPWSAIKGLRNRIVHDYGNVDYGIIYETVIDEIPYCLEMILKIIG